MARMPAIFKIDNNAKNAYSGPSQIIGREQYVTVSEYRDPMDRQAPCGRIRGKLIYEGQTQGRDAGLICFN